MSGFSSRLKQAPGRFLDRVSKSWSRRRRRRGEDGCEAGDEANSLSSVPVGAATSCPFVGGGDEDMSSVRDEPLLTEEDQQELLELLNKNISMDFILEMKEAFQLFDKVRKRHAAHESRNVCVGLISGEIRTFVLFSATWNLTLLLLLLLRIKKQGALRERERTFHHPLHLQRRVHARTSPFSMRVRSCSSLSLSLVSDLIPSYGA